MTNTDSHIINEFLETVSNKLFPCVAARAAVAAQSLHCMVANDIKGNGDDEKVLNFIYSFIDQYRAGDALYQSAAIIYGNDTIADEKEFDQLLWKKLQTLSDLDAINYAFDNRVDPDPQSPHFSFSLKGEAFFIIGLHSHSSRPARTFNHPVLVFNPHHQFDVLRQNHHFDSMKAVVRKRDLRYSGSLNPMLNDYGVRSEVFQYSGLKYDEQWKCPLQIHHGKPTDNSAT